MKTTDTLILKNIEWGSNDRVGDSRFFAEFDDHTLIEYIPKGLMYDEKKRTLWIGVNPNEVNIAFFHEDFEEGFNSDNETGVWMSLTKGHLNYNTEVVSKLSILNKEEV